MVGDLAVRVATAEPRGFARLDLGREAGSPAAIADAAVAFRALGFACARSSAIAGPGRLAAVASRHLAIFVLDSRDLTAAPVVVSGLAVTDGRRRLLVHAVPLPAVAARATPRWRARQETVGATVDRLIASLEVPAALDALSAIEVEAACRGLPLDASVALRRVQVLFFLGRFEEAWSALGAARGAADYDAWRACVAWARGDPSPLKLMPKSATPRSAMSPGASAIVAAQIDIGLAEVRRRRQSGVDRGLRSLRRGPPLSAALADRLTSFRDSIFRSDEDRLGRSREVPGLERFGEGRRAMNLLHAMPRLLQVVHDTEDETAMLRRACAWLIEHAGATAAAILARDDLRLVSGQGIEQADVVESQAADVLRTGAPRTVVTSQPIVCVPVRYAAATIGVVVARGQPGRVETLVEAATVVASLVGMALRARLDALALAGRGEALARDLLGDSLAMAELRESIARAAGSSFPVLIEGESGTGKELVASAVHRLSARRDRRLCAVNCAALTDELIEAEMFGHTRGAFTGAVGARPGLFEEAHRGSLFLDEVAELSPRGQAKLLRVLQEREIRRLGENAPRAVDVRVIGATNVPLADAVAHGRFREDLRFRLAVIRLRVPPLRDRIEDVPLLARAFWRRMSADSATRAVLGPEAVASLCRHAWPGNVRELQNVVAALVVGAPTRGVVTGRHVAAALGAAGLEPTPSVRLDAAVRGFERRVVAAALARHGGRRTGAAMELGLTRQGLTKAIRRLGLHSRDRDRVGVA